MGHIQFSEVLAIVKSIVLLALCVDLVISTQFLMALADPNV